MECKQEKPCEAVKRVPGVDGFLFLCPFERCLQSELRANKDENKQLKEQLKEQNRDSDMS